MEQPGIDADHERCAGDQPGGCIERPALGNPRIGRARRNRTLRSRSAPCPMAAGARRRGRTASGRPRPRMAPATPWRVERWRAAGCHRARSAAANPARSRPKSRMWSGLSPNASAVNKRFARSRAGGDRPGGAHHRSRPPAARARSAHRSRDDGRGRARHHRGAHQPLGVDDLVVGSRPQRHHEVLSARQVASRCSPRRHARNPRDNRVDGGMQPHQRGERFLDHPGDARVGAMAPQPRSAPACDGSRRRARRS